MKLETSRGGRLRAPKSTMRVTCTMLCATKKPPRARMHTLPATDRRQRRLGASAIGTTHDRLAQSATRRITTRAASRQAGVAGVRCAKDRPLVAPDGCPATGRLKPAACGSGGIRLSVYQTQGASPCALIVFSFAARSRGSIEGLTRCSGIAFAPVSRSSAFGNGAVLRAS